MGSFTMVVSVYTVFVNFMHNHINQRELIPYFLNVALRTSSSVTTIRGSAIAWDSCDDK